MFRDVWRGGVQSLKGLPRRRRRRDDEREKEGAMRLMKENGEVVNLQESK